MNKKKDKDIKVVRFKHNLQTQNELFQKFLDDKLVQNLQDNILKIKQTNKNRFNIFKVLKLDNSEIRHSNFLAWLLNPEETHNLGYKFIKEFFESYADIDWSKEEFINVETEVLTNKNRRIDILITGKNFLCVIENKYGSCEHDEQCKHYKNFIYSNENYKNIPNKYFVFLDIEMPDEKILNEVLKDYYPITYRKIYSILKNIIKNQPDNKIEIEIIKQYTLILKEKYSMLDENIKKECRKIYDKHKEVYEALKEFERDFQTDMYNIMKSVVNEDNNLINDDRNGFGYDNNTGAGVRFITKDIQKDYLLWNDKNTRHRLFFMIEYKNSLKLFIYDNWKIVPLKNEKNEKCNCIEIECRHKTNEEIKSDIKTAIKYLEPFIVNLADKYNTI